MAGPRVVTAMPAARSAVVTPDDVRAWLDHVPDPEIPVLSVNDLGIVRDISIEDGKVTVSVAPTYTGCPATEVIERMIVHELASRGLRDIAVRKVLSPPWTTDWISEAGRQKLRAFGIAPPAPDSGRLTSRSPGGVSCPRCESLDTVQVSAFGSTPCKAAWKCHECLEPFDYFKCL